MFLKESIASKYKIFREKKDEEKRLQEEEEKKRIAEEAKTKEKEAKKNPNSVVRFFADWFS